jgi:hypothetical protein
MIGSAAAAGAAAETGSLLFIPVSFLSALGAASFAYGAAEAEATSAARETQALKGRDSPPSPEDAPSPNL